MKTIIVAKTKHEAKRISSDYDGTIITVSPHSIGAIQGLRSDRIIFDKSVVGNGLTTEMIDSLLATMLL